ncbi:MAG: P-II family nitrogen regulator [Clostridia bacterium]
MGDSSVTGFEALVTIMDFGLRDVLSKLFKKNNMPISLLTHGTGSAKSAIYDILGYTGPKKIVTVSIQTEKMANHFLNQLESEVDFNKPGTGVACTISLSSISSILSMTLKQADENLEMGSDEMAVTQREPHHLIITIVNSGFFEQVMEAAKAAGATGGTLVHARGLGSKEAVKYLGITIQPEKDLVLILAPQETRRTIMESITREAGLNTAGKGICFSLPVNHAIGLQAGIENIDVL